MLQLQSTSDKSYVFSKSQSNFVRAESKVLVPLEHFSFPVLMKRVIFSFPLKTLMVLFFARLPERHLIDPVGSTVTYINMNTFHVNINISYLVAYCIKRPPLRNLKHII